MTKSKTPKALRFLRWFCPPQLLEEIEGDLMERYERDLKASDTSEVSRRLRSARLRLLWNTLRYFRPGILLRNVVTFDTFRLSMAKNHFLFALRIFSRSKAYALVSVVSLSVAVTSSVLVLEYSKVELSYDKFFPQHDRIFRLQHNRIVNGEVLYKKAMNFPEVGLAMKDYFAEVEEVARLFPVSLNIEPVFTVDTKNGDRRSFSEPHAYAADSTFCSIFKLDFLYGNPSTALAGLDRIIISRSTALRYFGAIDVIGEVFKGKDGDLTITGVFEDLPPNSHLRFDVLLSWFEMYEEKSRFTYDGFYNYILLKDGNDINNIQQRLPEFAQWYMGDYYQGRPNTYSQFEMQPLTSIHLDSRLDGEITANGNRNIVNVLLIVAALMIVIAIVNQVNLNTSCALARVKEVGVRKIIGSTRMQLIAQFFIESFLLTAVAASIGLIMAYAFYPWFNMLFHSQISSSLTQQSYFWVAAFAFVILIAFVSGVYPALLLIRLNVNKALKGGSIGEAKNYLQKTLVTIQFAVSLVLIVAAYVLNKQVNFMQMRDLGFGMQQRVIIKLLPTYGEESDSTFLQKMEIIKNELLSRSLCDASTISSSIPGRKNEWRGTARLANADVTIQANLTRVDEDFLDAYQIELIAGRSFTSSHQPRGAILVNEEATKQLGFANPEEAIGKRVRVFGEREIIGVVGSFHESGLHEALSPSMYITESGFMKYWTVSLTNGSVADQISEIERLWKTHFPHKPFQYFFLDEFFNRQYQADVTMSRSLGSFTGIAIMIACLGLFSLSGFTLNKKTKEIGIKKILGASVANITTALCGGFLMPVALSALLGVPASYYLSTWWLSQYAYKIDLSHSFFVFPLLILASIALLTVVFQSLKAANRNPVESLRYE